MSKHDYHDPHHGLRETYHDLEVEELEDRAKHGGICAACGRFIDFRILKDCHPIRSDCIFQVRARAASVNPS